MKQLIPLLFMFPALCFGQNNMGNKQIALGDLFEFSVSFEKSQTPKIQRYLNKKLSKGDMSFANIKLNATITLDNGMTFYINMQPGKLKIIFDKKKNTEKNYTRMKEACDGIRDIIR